MIVYSDTTRALWSLRQTFTDESRVGPISESGRVSSVSNRALNPIPFLMYRNLNQHFCLIQNRNIYATDLNLIISEKVWVKTS